MNPELNCMCPYCQLMFASLLLNQKTGCLFTANNNGKKALAHGEDNFNSTLNQNGLDASIMLSPQERKCWKLLSRGKSTKKIALELQLSPRTVECYLHKLRNKLGCSSSKELIAKYYERHEI